MYISRENLNDAESDSVDINGSDSVCMCHGFDSGLLPWPAPQIMYGTSDATVG
jgi:hypothetical protein